jgi:hypothetical protein
MTASVVDVAVAVAVAIAIAVAVAFKCLNFNTPLML